MKGGQLIILIIVVFLGYTYLQNNGTGLHYPDSGAYAPSSTTVLVEDADGYADEIDVPVSYENMEDQLEAFLMAYNDFLLDDHYVTYGNERQIFRDRQRFLKRYLPLMKSKFMRERENGSLHERKRRPKSGLFGLAKEERD